MTVDLAPLRDHVGDGPSDDGPRGPARGRPRGHRPALRPGPDDVPRVRAPLRAVGRAWASAPRTSTSVIEGTTTLEDADYELWPGGKYVRRLDASDPSDWTTMVEVDLHAALARPPSATASPSALVKHRPRLQPGGLTRHHGRAVVRAVRADARRPCAGARGHPALAARRHGGRLVMHYPHRSPSSSRPRPAPPAGRRTYDLCRRGRPHRPARPHHPRRRPGGRATERMVLERDLFTIVVQGDHAVERDMRAVTDYLDLDPRRHPRAAARPLRQPATNATIVDRRAHQRPAAVGVVKTVILVPRREDDRAARRALAVVPAVVAPALRRLAAHRGPPRHRALQPQRRHQHGGPPRGRLGRGRRHRLRRHHRPAAGARGRRAGPRARGRMVVPFEVRRNLNAQRHRGSSWRATRAIVDCPTCAATYRDQHSRVVCIPRRLYDDIGGFDEGFRGWGLEDTAFAIAVETLTGESLPHLPGDAWHLDHPPQGREARQLHATSPQRRPRRPLPRRRRHCGDMDAIRALVAEGRERGRRAPRTPSRASSTASCPSTTPAIAETWWAALRRAAPRLAPDDAPRPARPGRLAPDVAALGQGRQRRAAGRPRAPRGAAHATAASTSTGTCEPFRPLDPLLGAEVVRRLGGRQGRAQRRPRRAARPPRHPRVPRGAPSRPSGAAPGRRARASRRASCPRRAGRPAPAARARFYPTSTIATPTATPSWWLAAPPWAFVRHCTTGAAGSEESASAVPRGRMNVWGDDLPSATSGTASSRCRARAPGRPRRATSCPPSSSSSRAYGVTSVLDVACGDGFWMPDLPGYLGIDRSAESPSACTARATPSRRYVVRRRARPGRQGRPRHPARRRPAPRASPTASRSSRRRAVRGRCLLASTYRGGDNIGLRPRAPCCAAGPTTTTSRRRPSSLGAPLEVIPDG